MTDEDPFTIHDSITTVIGIRGSAPNSVSTIFIFNINYTLMIQKFWILGTSTGPPLGPRTGLQLISVNYTK
jgi:hypothetical protein